jgi:hypothetical protein
VPAGGAATASSATVVLDPPAVTHPIPAPDPCTRSLMEH